MFDNLNAHNGKDGLGRARAPKPADDSLPLADREVPIGLSQMPAEVHSWLDGELTESSMRSAGTARHVEFWSRINAEVETRRQVRTPVHLQAQIMAALPQATPQLAPETTTSWWKRPLEVTPMVAAAAAAGLVALGAALGISSRER
jgi:hypothetical protein